MKKNKSTTNTKLHSKAVYGLIGFGILFFLALIRNDFHLDKDLLLVPIMLLAILVLLSPAIIVQVYNLKIKNPKPVFVEPTYRRMLLFILVWSVITFLLIVGIFGSYMSDSNIGWVLGGWTIVAFFLPLNLYMVNIHTRYARLVEYDTTEWHRIKNENK